MKQYICIFAKPPFPGKTKTRLAATTGDQVAADLSRAMILDIAQECLKVADTQVTLWYPPGASPSDYAALNLPKNLEFYQQQGVDLGARMNHALMTLLGQSQRVIIVGSDCITHSAESLQQAFQILHQSEVVIQPANDGGYVLIGQNCHHDVIFQNISWGSSQVMAESLKKLLAHNISFQKLPETFDVDTLEDLPCLYQFLQKNPRPHCQNWFAIHPQYQSNNHSVKKSVDKFLE